MSILIKGVSIPKSCGACPLEQLYGRDREVAKCPLTEKIFSSYLVSEIRMPDCPLIELPPHGDLIDRDTLKTMFALTSIVQYGFSPNNLIDDAPTIIEAEGEDG